MCFFIGGIQPKTVNLDDSRQLCPSCGLHQVRTKRIDHYISFFFIPILRVKTGEPFMMCERCGTVSGDSNAFILDSSQAKSHVTCRNCGRPLKKEFAYCPYCGTSIT